jgi:RHS repeat-associated protein
MTHQPHPFGMLLVGRTFDVNYRYGFNGKEHDSDPYGQGNVYDYGFRIYNPRLGKFLSVDPLTKSFPGLTVFQYASNSPILNIDLDGLEGIPFVFYFLPKIINSITTLDNQTEEAVAATVKAVDPNNGLPEEVNSKLPPITKTVAKVQTTGDAAEKINTVISNIGHTSLDILGAVPVVGEGFDIVNGVWYAGENNYEYAALSFLSAVGVGEVFKWVKNAKIAGKIGSSFEFTSNAVALLEKSKVKINTVAAYKQNSTQKIIVIGRNQTGRVEVVADELKLAGYEVSTFKLSEIELNSMTEAEQLTANYEWITQKLKEGYNVIDIGLDPNYTAKGNFFEDWFYKMEKDQVNRFFENKMK